MSPLTFRWSPSSPSSSPWTWPRAYFTDAEALELTFDVMRNAANKIAVALGGNSPRVEQGTERYFLGLDDQPVYV